MVCKQLGFSHAKSIHIESHFGPVTTQYSFQDLACNGDESTLDQCSISGSSRCYGTREGAGVTCSEISISKIIDHGKSDEIGSGPNWKK